MDELTNRTKLETLRQEIDELDKDLLELFEARMLKVSEIADFKKANNLTILDESREEKVLENIRVIVNQSFHEPAERFLKYIMEISRSIQADYIRKVSAPSIASEINNMLEKRSGQGLPSGQANRNAIIGFQGLPGSYSEQALREYFGEDIPNKNLPNFEDVFKALESGEIDYGVLPLENSFTGGIAEVYDLLCRYGFYIVGEKGIKVEHNLLALAGAEIRDIEEVYSHPQALQQCSGFLQSNSNWNLISCSNTAVSAKIVSESASMSKAAIASKRAASLYGLTILRSYINNDSYNYTRFIIIGRKLEINNESDKISLAVAISHEPGSLYRVLSHFAKNGLNMLKIESRPIMNKPWEYLFYVDFEGSLGDETVKEAVRGIREDSAYFQMLGNYQADIRNFIR